MKRVIRQRLFAAFAACAIAATVAIVIAAAGDLNNGFSGDGKVATDMEHAITTARAVLVQPDGKVLVGGDASGNYALARFNADGTADTSFQGGGRALYDFGDDFNELLYDLALQEDGKIVGAGRWKTGMALIRWNTNGSVDTDFGTDGMAIFDDNGQPIDGSGVAVDDDGLILVGRPNPGTINGGFAITKFTFEGLPDTNFAGGGIVNNSMEGPQDVAIDGDGNIVIVGGSHSFNATGDVVIERYQGGGSPDTDFGGGDGIVVQDFSGNFDRALSMAIDSNDRILIAGQTNRGTIDFLVARFNGDDGSLDTDFAGDGGFERDFSGGNDSATAITTLDNRIVVSGYGAASFTTGILMGDGTPDNSFSGDGFVQTQVAASGFQVPADVFVRDGDTVITGGGDGTVSLLAYTLNGAFDTSFSGDGAVFFQMPGGNDIATVVLELPGDKLLAIGGAVNETGLARYNFNGTLDTSFGEGGRVVINVVPGVIEGVTDAALQEDGKIIIVGHASGGFFVARLNADGTEDNSFAGGVFTASGAAYSVVIQDDGKTVVAGTSGEGDFLVMRFDSQGVPDPDFGTNGIMTTEFTIDELDEAHSVILDGDKIVTAGYTQTPSNKQQFAVARYNNDGSPDNNFSGDGKQIINFTDDASIADIKARQGGGYIAAGVHGSTTDEEEFALVALTPGGDLDGSLDGDGKLTYDPGSVGGEATRVREQTDGKFVVGGYVTHVLATGDMLVVRFNSDGTPDSSFSGDGKVEIDFNGLEDNLLDMFVRPDTTIVGAGYADSNLTQWDFALVQIKGDGEPQTPAPTTPAGEERIWGDNNCSGDAPNPVDGLLALRFDGGLPTNTGACPDMGEVVEVGSASPHPWGDIDCGGTVNPVDSLKLLRFDGGLTVVQPEGCPEIGDTVLISVDE